MYELNCPSCKHVIQRPFLRVGAQSVCSACAHRFTIQRDMIRRSITVPADSGDESDNPLLLGGAATKPPPPQRPTAQAPASPPAQPPPQPSSSPGARTADTGISVAALTAVVPPGQALTPIQPVPEHKDPSPDVARLIARHRARRQRRGKLVLIILIISLMLMVFLGAVVLKMVQQGQGFGESLGGLFGMDSPKSNDPDNTLSELPATLPIVRAELIPRSFWKEADDSYDGVAPEGRVRVTGKIRATGAERYVYEAQVHSAGFDVIEEAQLHLALVDSGQVIFGRCQVPLILVSGQALENPTRPFTVAVPDKFAKRTEEVVTKVIVEKVLPGGVMFPKVIFTPTGSGAHTALKIVAYNPQPTAMQRAVFYIRAFNSRGETLLRWRAHWNRRIEPQQRVELAVITPIEQDDTVEHWEVVGAGGFDQNEETAR